MSTDGGDTHREDLWRQYGHTLEEYRFQVQLERELGLGQLAIRTTPGMDTSSRARRRILTVSHVQTTAFIVLGLVHVVGVVVALR